MDHETYGTDCPFASPPSYVTHPIQPVLCGLLETALSSSGRSLLALAMGAASRGAVAALVDTIRQPPTLIDTIRQAQAAVPNVAPHRATLNSPPPGCSMAKDGAAVHRWPKACRSSSSSSAARGSCSIGDAAAAALALLTSESSGRVMSFVMARAVSAAMAAFFYQATPHATAGADADAACDVRASSYGPTSCSMAAGTRSPACMAAGKGGHGVTATSKAGDRAAAAAGRGEGGTAAGRDVPSSCGHEVVEEVTAGCVDGAASAARQSGGSMAMALLSALAHSPPEVRSMLGVLLAHCSGAAAREVAAAYICAQTHTEPAAQQQQQQHEQQVR